MRLFIAINFTTEMKKTLLSMQDQFKKQNVRGKYSPAENLHLTLAFIGEYDDPEKVLETISALDYQPFDLTLDGVGSFGSLWWAGLSESKELTKCTSGIRHLLAEAEIPFDRKSFRPHITLIREPDKNDIPAVSIPNTTMRVSCISLMRSDRGKRGMIYTEIGRI